MLCVQLGAMVGGKINGQGTDDFISGNVNLVVSECMSCSVSSLFHLNNMFIIVDGSLI